MEKQNKREFRELSDETKQKISTSLKGRSKSFTHAENISKGLKNYWETIPNRPEDGQGNNSSTNPLNDEEK